MGEDSRFGMVANVVNVFLLMRGTSFLVATRDENGSE